MKDTGNVGRGGGGGGGGMCKEMVRENALSVAIVVIASHFVTELKQLFSAVIIAHLNETS